MNLDIYETVQEIFFCDQYKIENMNEDIKNISINFDIKIFINDV